ncbi:MAG: hypothetical protein LBL37_09065, partial [Gracilibacteraceae bacterium]|nr:hypothetical protein [Gracilibacteraceae bacterium]
MKKAIILAVVIAAALFGLSVFNPWAAPSLAEAEPRIAAALDGSVCYFAVNRSYGSFVFGVNERGQVGFVYTDKAVDESGRRYAVADLLWSGGQLWLLREAGEDRLESGETVRRQIWRLDPETGIAAAAVPRLTFRGGAFRLSADGERIYLSYRDADGRRAYAYAVNADGGAAGSLALAVDAPADTLIRAAVYSGKYLYCALSDGSVRAFNAAGVKTEFTGGETGALWAGGDNLFFVDTAANSAHFTLNSLPAHAVPPARSETITAGLPLADGFVALAAAPDGGAALLRYAGASFGDPVPLASGAGANLRFSLAAA